MESFLGKWKTESGQGFDEFLKDRGVGFALRTAVKTTTTESTFGKESDGSWSLTQENYIAGKLFKTKKIVWKDGVEFSTQAMDDSQVKMTFKFADGCLVTTEKTSSGVESRITRRVEGDKLIVEGMWLARTTSSRSF
eukprot:TRINITY_DN6741_c0_g1_i2.p1 TRINITY_DN6741_c0_g1~~TRINITY_DN6741_c0_g1_i2.p1  ORF type:complete len:137 (-),score=46.34 TRINITY_DN6741_c0_g1_i2:28-438(-)